MLNPCEVPDPGLECGNRAESVEAWAAAYVAFKTPLEKLSPPPVPEHWSKRPENVSIPRVPGREGGFEVVERASKFPKISALSNSHSRAKVLHTFLHHEIQAAELYCRALIAFHEAPFSFREGLLRVAQDEIRHAGLYQQLLLKEGATYGSLPVRDWFWHRGLECADPLSFVSFVGLGLEGANLDHADRFELGFRAGGAEECARVQARVGVEEESHVRFAQTWFDHWTEGRFTDWCAALPKPLSPLIFRGEKINREARLRAGQPAHFLDELEAWRPSGS